MRRHCRHQAITAGVKLIIYGAAFGTATKAPAHGHIQTFYWSACRRLPVDPQCTKGTRYTKRGFAFTTLRILGVFNLLKGITANDAKLSGQGTSGFQFKPMRADFSTLDLESGIKRIAAQTFILRQVINRCGEKRARAWWLVLHTKFLLAR